MAASPRPAFRELAPIKRWTTAFATSVSWEFMACLGVEVVHELRLPVLGTFADGVFTLSRHPSPRYRVPSIPQCEQVAALLMQKAEGQRLVQKPRGDLQVVMGLREVYNQSSPTHTVQEVRQLLPKAQVSPLVVISVRLIEGRARVYTEPGVSIVGRRRLLPRIQDAAHKLRQEQFSVDYYPTRKSSTVLTAWAK